MTILDRFQRPFSNPDAEKTVIDGFGFKLPEKHGHLLVDPATPEGKLAKAGVELANRLSHLLHCCAHELVALRERVEKLEAEAKEAAEPEGAAAPDGAN